MSDEARESVAQLDPLPVVFGDVYSASLVLQSHAHRTPIQTSSVLNNRTGAEVFVKCENFQRTGAFKFRGAFNALSSLSTEERSRGVLTYSSGNHGQALALAGSLLSIPTTVIMPDDAPGIKKRATAAYGAEIIFYDRAQTTREDLSARISGERNLPVIPPYNHPAVIAGQGTVGLELLSSQPDLDLLLVCCGGGGLLSGCAIAAKHLQPACRVVGVEPAAADDACRSFHSGTLHTVNNPDTIADGARTPYLGSLTFPLVLRHVDDMVSVSEESILRAMKFYWERMKLVVEPTGALALAALLDGTVRAAGQRVGVVISGGNVDLLYALSLFKRLPDDTV
jgi:threo-3-hydroxy-L-aspartate ammonia-lyase